MTLNQINYAVAIAGENSITGAAKKLFVSQPSLSESMHQLEKECGFEIFVRTWNGTKLTEKGSAFIAYAETILKDYERLEQLKEN